MSEKPQEARGGEQADLLEHIIAQGLEKMTPRAQAVTEEAAPADEASSDPTREDGGEAAPPANRKNRCSAVYLYLVILFGAAFLLLLLAYFIQQRSSETAISDLRESMTLSREGLLAEIRGLEEQNRALSEELDVWKEDLFWMQEHYEEKRQEADDLWNEYCNSQEELYSWASFWMLESYYHQENLEACAGMLLMQEQGQYTYRAPDKARQAETIQAVIGAGILDENYKLHPERYEDLLEAYISGLPVTITSPGSVDWTKVTFVIR